MRCPRLTTRSLRQLATALALALVACAPAGPRDVRYGQEACGYCRMTITDRRFGGQVASARGRLEVFDAIECLADYVNRAAPDAPAGAPRAWVADFQQPGTWIPVDSARFVRLTRAASPMGAGLAALRAGAPAGTVATDGPAMTWAELLAARRAARPERTAHVPQAAHVPHDAHAPHAVHAPNAAGGAHAD